MNHKDSKTFQIRTTEQTIEKFRAMCHAEGRDSDGLLRELMRVYQMYLDAQKITVEVKNETSK